LLPSCALRLESEKRDGERVYRIVAGKASADATDQPRRQQRTEGAAIEAEIARVRSLALDASAALAGGVRTNATCGSE
jgi:hypothetical protein